ncbi:MAG: transglutaminase domain-containing protein [Abditibacteriales bacterium]|nr:transglutaminase domain-containing protein [Abditibacteriales bacterium]MDW8367731.1 transglutaminase domain-containing protein [Abditibacteriales bacterium]
MLSRTASIYAVVGIALLMVGGNAHSFEPPKQRTFEITYRAVVKDIPTGAQRVEIWIPVPQSDAHQQISRLNIKSPVPYKITQEKEYGNKSLYLLVKEPKASTLTVEMTFQVTRREHINRPFLTASKGNAPTLTANEQRLMRRFLQPDALVPINQRIRTLSQEVVGDKTDEPSKVKAIYDYVVANVKYDKSGQGWGRGDLMFVCDEKRGNCSDFHALIIGMARAQNIPARFAIGLPLPAQRGEGKIGGYHCWAELYLKDYGWVPVDASEAAKDPSKKEYFFGAHDENRVQLSLGRDITLSPKPKGGPLNFFVYPYVEVDGKAHDAVEKEFTYRDL